ncbi:BTAD domain-containing putative transcriptional regulator [Streptomyces sp. NBRC 110028]|uniref:AfsR/SARP family transcriptional regulator n=1 Tax=Streptomyces sp. NBRC 110028 TaxID=1621260 RepID=UPI00099F0C10|nr:BTAD domain-containing putative transcriptional regulator [Streptomyces sp. NBRC 110028]
MKTEARLLGPVELTVNDTDVTPTSVRARVFLASLLLRCGQPVPIETLTEELWADSPPASARAQLHTHASHLRRRIDHAGGTGAGRQLLATHPIGYTLLVPPQDLDLTRFAGLLDEARSQSEKGRHERVSELLRTADTLWRGPALAGVTTAPRLAAQAQRLEDQHREAATLCLDAELRLGRHARVISELRALVQEHPDHQPFRALLSRALHETSRTTEALDIRRQPPPSSVPPDEPPPHPEPLAAPVQRPAKAPQPLRFTVLGPIRAWRGEEPISAGSPQQRALLAALLLRRGRTATASELIDALWGEEPPEAAIAALRTYASRLRKALGPDSEILVNESGGYALRIEPDALDIDMAARYAAEAEKAQHHGDRLRARDLFNEALTLFQGEPLAGVPGPYAETQRTRLEEWHLSLIETRLDLDLELGHHSEAVSELTALTASYPLRERLRELLMLALYRSGRQAEALAVYADTRRLLADELGVDPRPELSDLQQRILQADIELAVPTPAPAERDRLTRPAQLPATVPDFTGRAVFVEELSSQLTTAEGRAMAVSAIAGIGGIGKTTLAVHVAHAARPSFPDGQLYVDLQGGAPTAADPEAVLGSFLRALDTPDAAIPDGIEERAALYRSLLDGRRVLVLLDNARDAAQVRPLLPGIEGCATLVTSRTRLVDLAGAHLVDLDVMSPDEALALFTRIVGEERVAGERDAAMDVVAACGFLPLAIRIAAARLAARRTWTVSSLAQRLADGRHRLDELRAGDLGVKATFEMGYGQLAPGQARAFRLLALADGPDISLTAAATLLGTDTFATEELLESLVDASLLESAVPGRYRYQELVRLFARDCAERDEPPSDRDTALSRLLDFYLATAARIYARERPGDRLVEHLTPTAHPGLDFPDRDAALDWLFDEGDCLLACTTQAATGVDPGRAADILLAASDLAESGSHTRRYEAVAATLSTAAHTAGDLRAESRARAALAHALHLRGQAETAHEQAQRALSLGLAAEDPAVSGRLPNQCGITAILLRRYAEAEEHFRQAIDAFRADRDRPGEAAALCHLSRVRSALGRTADAVELAGQGVALYESLGLTLRLANGRYALGLALAAAGRLREAADQLTEAVDSFRENRQRLWEGTAHHRLADIELALHRPGEAAAHAEEALTLGLVGGDRRRASTLTVLGKALAELGQVDRASACWREAIALYDQLGTAEGDEVRELLDPVQAF